MNEYSLQLLELTAHHKFLIHPKAKPAYDFYHDIAPAMPGIHDKAFSLHQKLPLGQVFQGVRQENRIKIFAGFEHVFFDIEALANSQSVVLIYDNITEADIEQMAWRVTLRAICSAKDEKWIRANFYEFAKANLPSDISQEYFNKRKLTKNLLARLLDIKINTLIDYIQRHKDG